MDDGAVPVRNEREQANWMLNVLLQHGWLELHMDEVTLTSTYSFSLDLALRFSEDKARNRLRKCIDNFLTNEIAHLSFL